MLIDRVYQLIMFIANKEQRGNITPSQFNVAAEMAQLEFISRRLGNLKQIGNNGLPQYGYEQSWRVHEDLQPMVTLPEVINLLPDGHFFYPYGYIHVNAISKTDYRPVKRLTEDQYPHVKHNPIIPPSPDYPIAIFRGPYGFIDPYNIGSVRMSYLKYPPVPIWAYVNVNDSPVFDAGSSVDFQVPAISGNELAVVILAHCGINLNAEQIAQYALAKDAAGT